MKLTKNLNRINLKLKTRTKIKLKTKLDISGCNIFFGPKLQIVEQVTFIQP